MMCGLDMMDTIIRPLHDVSDPPVRSRDHALAAGA